MHLRGTAHFRNRPNRPRLPWGPKDSTEGGEGAGSEGVEDLIEWVLQYAVQLNRDTEREREKSPSPFRDDVGGVDDDGGGEAGWVERTFNLSLRGSS